MQTLNPEWVWAQEGLLSHHSVILENGQISAVVPRERASGGQELRGCLLMPGLVDAHSHAFQRAFRGRVQWKAAGQGDFWTWREQMYGVASSLSPEGVEAVSRLAFLEMVEGGVTHVGEFHYLHHQPDGTPYDDPDELAHRMIAAARSVGLRITLLRVAYARAGAGRPPEPLQRRFVDTSPDRVLAAVARLSKLEDPRVTIGLAPHSVRALDRRWLEALSVFDGVVHAHVSEQRLENQACLEEHGCTPTQLLEDVGLLTERTTGVHLTWPEEGDVARWKRAGGRVCVCPTTEMDLGDGLLPLEARQLPLCLGSDSHARIDLFEEARSLELHARALAGKRVVMGTEGPGSALAARLLGAATREGSIALGAPSGGIAPGMPADLCAVRLDQPAAIGVPPLEAVAFSAGPEWVHQVWVGGDALLQEGRHPLRDEVMARALPHLG